MATLQQQVAPALFSHMMLSMSRYGEDVHRVGGTGMYGTVEARVTEPKLEYAAAVCDPQPRQQAQSNTLVDKLEAAQRWAVRFISRDYPQASHNSELHLAYNNEDN
ncbi:hypothetical protein Bbelb_192890 [Branchiostoma belcheri]|nr:hypothetical protein Bbelb_192890 [Branchiostoma belcheri]